MLQKVVTVENIGKFSHCTAGNNDFRFEPLTLVYGENGSGKSTISAILRSLAAGDSAFIMEKQRVGEKAGAQVSLRFDNRTIDFKNAAWSERPKQLHVFDEAFVHQNVCSSVEVTPDQRQGLRSIVIGESGIQLKDKVSDLEQAIKKTNNKSGEIGQKLQKFIHGMESIENFVALKKIEKVNEAIEQKKIEIRTLADSNKILQTEPFSKIEVPEIDLEILSAFLGRTLTDLHTEAEQRVRDHLTKLPEEGEQWVHAGLEFAENDCPFCGRTLDGIDLVHDYQAYFSAEYSKLKKAVANSLDTIESRLGEAKLGALNVEALKEEGKLAFWSNFIGVTNVVYPLNALKEIWANLREELRRHLKDKSSRPLEKVEIDLNLVEAHQSFVEARMAILKVSDERMAFNGAIAKRKAEVGSKTEELLNKELKQLANAKSRHETEVAALCDDYEAAREEKKKSENAKTKAREDLAKQTKETFEKYQKAINGHLKNFGAGFRIEALKKSDVGGPLSSTFEIVIHGERIKNLKRAKGKVSFGSALSSGDRNALGLAFFFSKIDQLSSMSEQVIIIDDPISSMDENRQICTQQVINRLAKDSKQVVLLSHSAEFLRRVWDHSEGVKKNTFRIARKTDEESEFARWEIELETQSEYHKLRGVLVESQKIGKGDPRTVASSIRPLIEGFLRIRYPDALRPGQWLGDFMKSAQKAEDAGTPLISKSDGTELDAIKNYSNPFHHNTNPTMTVGPINQTQLAAYVNRALTFVEP